MKNILCSLAVLWLALGSLPAQGQTALDLMSGKAAAADQQNSEQELQELMHLLSNPVLIERLKQRLPVTIEHRPGEALSGPGLQQRFQAKRDLVKQRVREILHALTTLPRLPKELSVAWNANIAASDFLQSVTYVIIFLFGGFGLEWLYWSYLSATLTRIELSKPKTYGSILKAAVLRAVLLFGSIAVFASGSVGLFVGFEWSPFVDQIVLSLLAGIIAMRLIIMIGVFVLAPKVEDLRLMPLDRTAARMFMPVF